MRLRHSCGAELHIKGREAPDHCAACGGPWYEPSAVVSALEALTHSPVPQGAARRAVQELMSSEVWVPGRLVAKDGTVRGDGDITPEDAREGDFQLLRIVDADGKPFLPVFTDEGHFDSFMSRMPDQPGALSFPFRVALNFLVDRAYVGLAVNPGRPECLLLYKEAARRLLAGRIPADLS